jgi:uncharacterized protein (TIGR04255 family)
MPILATRGNNESIMPEDFAGMPLFGAPPDEVPLKDAPLVLVVAQVRFPTLLAIRNPDRLSGFQEAIRSRYPYLEREEVRGFQIGPSGPEGGTNSAVHWRFWDESRHWRATLTQDFVSLETLQYTSREDFLKRLEEILEAFLLAFKPTHSGRVGVRYIDQISPPRLGKIDRLVNREVLGAFCSLGSARAEHLLTQLVVDVEPEPGRLTARWGFLPAGSTPDAVVGPSQQDSWIIDLDVGVIADERFTVSGLIGKARGSAERIYSIFRWMVTDEFLSEYKGDEQ